MNRRFVRFLWFLLLILFACTGVVSGVWIGTAVAQSQWTPERPIPEYNDRRPPLMVVDSAGTVHAFNSARIPDTEDLAIYYRTWTLADSWSNPVDIFLSPEQGPIRVQDVLIDENNQLHMVFFAGNPPQTGNIYYTTVSALEAGNARAWSEPKIIGADAGPLSLAKLARDDRGRIVVIYGGQGDGIGLYVVKSLDNGVTWSVPTILSLVSEEDRWPATVRTTWGDDGTLHIVWSVTNNRALGEAIFYAQLDPEFKKWSLPVVMATLEASDYSANWPSITFYDDKLFVLYMDDFPPTRFLRISEDGGKTWSDPTRPFPHIGEYEQAVFLEDSDGTLHMILGDRTNDPNLQIHGMWTSIWEGDRWTPLEPIVSAPRSNKFDPSSPRAVIVNGNVMLVAWWHNATGSEFPDFSYSILDSKAIPPVPVNTPTPNPTAVLDETTQTAVTNTLTTPISSDIAAQAALPAPNPGTPLFFGVIPVILIILLIMGFIVLRSKYRSK